MHRQERVAEHKLVVDRRVWNARERIPKRSPKVSVVGEVGSNVMIADELELDGRKGIAVASFVGRCQ